MGNAPKGCSVNRGITSVVVCLFVLAVARPGCAQLDDERNGDLVVNDSTTALRVDHDAASLTSVLLSHPSLARALQADNGDWLALAGTSVFSYFARGIYTTIQRGAPLVMPVDLRSVRTSSGDVEYILDQTGPTLYRRQNRQLTTILVGAPLVGPTAMRFTVAGDLLIADPAARAIFKRDAAGVLTTLKQNGALDRPVDVEASVSGDVWIADDGATPAVFRIGVGGRLRTMHAGAPLVTPVALTIDVHGVLVADRGAGAVFRVDPSNRLSTVATNLGSLAGLSIAGADYDDVIAIDEQRNAVVLLRGSERAVRTFIGETPTAFTRNALGEIVVATPTSVYAVGPSGALRTIHRGTPIANARGIAVDAYGDYFVGGTVAGNGMLWRVQSSSSGYTVTTFYDGAQRHGGAVQSIEALDVDGLGNLIVLDQAAKTLWALDPAGNALTTLHRGAPLNAPEALVADEGFYVGDGPSVFQIQRGGLLTTLFTAPTARRFTGVAIASGSSGVRTVLAADRTTGDVLALSPTGGPNATHYRSASTLRGLSVGRSTIRHGDVVASFSTATPWAALTRVGARRETRLVITPQSYDLDTRASALEAAPGGAELLTTFHARSTPRLSGVLRLTPNGARPLWLGAPLAVPTGVTVDEGGRTIVVDAGPSAAIYRLDPAGITTVASGAPLATPAGVCIDGFTGDYVIADTAFAGLVRVTESGVISTAATGLAGITGAVFNPLNGRFLASTAGGAILEVDRAGIATTLRSGFEAIAALHFTPTHELFVAENGPTKQRIVRVDLTSNNDVTYDFAPGGGPDAVAVAGGRMLSGRGPRTVGSNYELCLAVPEDRGLSYGVGAAFATLPAVRFDGRRWTLQPDDLTVASINVPWLFPRFTGVLDRYGRARPRVRLPNDARLIGTRIHFAALTLDPTYGSAGVKTLSNTIAITIR